MVKEHRCKVKPIVEIRPRWSLDGDREIECKIVWEGVKLDRPSTHSIILRAGKLQLARRFQKAVEDGAVYKNPRVTKDVNGKTYIVCDGGLLARHLNAELQKLGY